MIAVEIHSFDSESIGFQADIDILGNHNDLPGMGKMAFISNAQNAVVRHTARHISGAEKGIHGLFFRGIFFQRRVEDKKFSGGSF